MPAEARRLDLKPMYTLAEVATALGFTRPRDGLPDSDKAGRRMAALGVPVGPGRPRTVLAEDLRMHAPKLFGALVDASESAQGAFK